MITLIRSDDEYLAEEAVDHFLAGAGESDEIISLHCEGGLPPLDEPLHAGSLFATRRFVVLRDAQTLKKADLERLTASLAAGPSADVAVVAVADRQPTALIKALGDVAETVALTKPRRGELIGWVGKTMKAAGLTPGRDAAATMVEVLGEDLRRLRSAVDQLAIRAPGAAIQREDVLAQFTRDAHQPIWALFDAIVAHDGPKAYRLLHDIVRHGDEPLPVLFALVSQVRYLIRARSILDRDPTANENDIAKQLGVTRGRAAVLRRQLGRLSTDWLLGVYRLLAEADVDLKGGEDGAALGAEVVLERVVAGALDAH